MSSSNTPIDKGKAQMPPNEEDLGLQEEVPRPWKCGEPYKYSIPRDDGIDYWSTLLEPLMKVDKAQCAAWKNELENLLIFAGLFSAVVTAFVVESYKNLQPDPNETAVVLLARIAARLDNPLNATASFIEPDPIQIPSFTPSTSSIHVNACWFFSLVLSLSSVLVGIISLQWLREHQAYHETTTARQKFALFHMRAEMLEKWRVPAIMTSLPLLLQLALVLFFAGILEFLLALGIQKVFIPVLILIAVTLAFFAATTVLPTIQAYIHGYSRLSPNFPVPCPYKSPQSHAFHLFFGWVQRVISILLATPVIFMETIKSIKPRADGVRQFNRPSTFGIWRVAESTTWMKSDLAWLFIRGAHIFKSSYMQNLEYQIPDTVDAVWSYDVEHGPLYDEVRGLLDAGRYSLYDDKILAAYHCFQECLQPNQKEDDKNDSFGRGMLCNYYQGVARILDCATLSFQLVPSPWQFLPSNLLNPVVLCDEVLCTFLNDISNSFLNSRKFSRALVMIEIHTKELAFRMNQFSLEAHVHDQFCGRGKFLRPWMVLLQEKYEYMDVLSEKISADFAKQAHILIKSFLNIVTLQPTKFGEEYSSYADVFDDMEGLTDVEFLKPSLLSTLSVIRSKLLPYLDPESKHLQVQSQESPPMELHPLFCIGAILVMKISKQLPDFYQDIEIAKAVDGLRPILHRFRELLVTRELCYGKNIISGGCSRSDLGPKFATQVQDVSGERLIGSK